MMFFKRMMSPFLTTLIVINAFSSSKVSAATISTPTTVSQTPPTTTKDEDLPWKTTPFLENLYQFETYAQENVGRVPWLYLNLAHTYGTTKANNEAAFQKIQLHPKRLIPVSGFNSATTVLGRKVSTPVGFAPLAVQKMFHPDGELAVSRAANSRQTVHILSQWASVTIEENARDVPNATLWQQVQFSTPRNHTINIVQRAEAAGYHAIVITIDDTVDKPSFLGNVTAGEMYGAMPDLVNIGSDGFDGDPDQSWDDVKWLTRQTRLPIVVKGLLDAGQVKDAKKAGASAIIVSNHGGRVLDGAPATIEVLAEVVEAVEVAGGGMEVYLDSGVRKGLDVYRALALGARFVFIGRPQVWGAVYKGQEGVEQVLDLLSSEFVNTAKMSGTPNIKAIDRSYLRAPWDEKEEPVKTSSDAVRTNYVCIFNVIVFSVLSIILQS